VTDGPPRPDRVRLSVVVPIHESADTLEACVAALLVAREPFDEIIIADDGSTDAGWTVLPQPMVDEVSVVTSTTNIGRGPVRNLGAANATGDVLVFVDADVAVHADALDQLRSAFEADPDCAAIIGSYDARPAHPGIVSQYRNLLHHHTHHTRGPTATHFWTGLGAVRRDVFAAMGGLDEYTWARNMEDVEFGHRVVDAGHTIVVLPTAQGTHHKKFTLGSMVRTDLFNRAIPWSALMLHSGLRTDPFVASSPQTVSVAMSLLVVLGLVVWPFSVSGAWVALAALGVFVAVNVRLWRFFVRARGPLFVLAAIPLHLLHSLLAGVGFLVALTTRIAGVVTRRRPAS
jgi:GT2 family glycosyltransferase